MTEDSPQSPVSESMSTQDGLDLYDRNRLAPTFFGVLFFASLAALVYTLSAFVHDLVLALVLVAMFRPPYLWVCRLFGGRRWLASGCVTGAILLLVAAPLVVLSVALLEQAQLAYGAAAEWLGEGMDGSGPFLQIVGKAEGLLAHFGIKLTPEHLQSVLEHVLGVAQDSALAVGESALSNLLALLIHGSVLLVVVFYLLVDADRVRDFVFLLSPLPQEEEELLVRRFSRVAKGTLIGNGIASVAQGALCGLAMWAAGLPSPLFAAAVTSLLAFLPLVGVSLIVIPLGVYLFFTGSPTTAALFLGFCLGQAAILENIVKTKLIGAGAAMHDLLAFLAIVGGLAAFGVLGLLYGPLLATAFLTLTDLYFQRYRRTLALNFIGRRQ